MRVAPPRHTPRRRGGVAGSARIGRNRRGSGWSWRTTPGTILGSNPRRLADQLTAVGTGPGQIRGIRIQSLTTGLRGPTVRAKKQTGTKSARTAEGEGRGRLQGQPGRPRNHRGVRSRAQLRRVERGQARSATAQPEAGRPEQPPRGEQSVDRRRR